MTNKVLLIGIISDNPVFYTSMEIMIDYYFNKAVVKVFKSLNELKETVISTNFDLFLIDDVVQGAALLESVSFLRQNRKETCSILYFGVDVHDMKTKAFRRGVNYFYNKPFDPRMVIYELVNNWVPITQNQYERRVS
jgi:DNA-binding NtrC family response regulator